MADERDAVVVDDALVHRRSHERGEFARLAAGNRAIEERDHVARAAPVEGAGPTGVRKRQMQAGDRIRDARARLAEPHADPELPGTVLEHFAVSEYHDSVRKLALRKSKADVGADARRLAGGHRDRRSGIRAG